MFSLRRGRAGAGLICVKDLGLLKAFKSPPEMVVRVFNVVLILLQHNVGWEHTLSALANPLYSFLLSVATLKKESVTRRRRPLSSCSHGYRRPT